jgi:hypothetical protein
LMSAETKVDLEIELLTSNTIIEPVFHPNGGVADFNLVIDGNTSLASTVYTDEKLAAMLEKWCSLTGQTPAHRLVNKADEEDTDKSLSTDQEQNQEIISYGKQDIVEALEKAPELVKAAETFKATSGHIVSSLADAVKQRPQAEIPESELQKISQTPCAPPDVDSFQRHWCKRLPGYRIHHQGKG